MMAGMSLPQHEEEDEPFDWDSQMPKKPVAKPANAPGPTVDQPAKSNQGEKVCCAITNFQQPWSSRSKVIPLHPPED